MINGFGDDHDRPRRLSPQRRNHSMQLQKRGFLGQAGTRALVAVSAGRHQGAARRPEAGDVSRTAGRSRARSRSTCRCSAAPGTGCATRCRSAGCGASGAAIIAARSRSGSCCGWSGATATFACARPNKPEFDAWRWHDYWVPTQDVIEFKRDVYQQALNELSRYLARHADPRQRKGQVRGVANIRWPAPNSRSPELLARFDRHQ